MTRTLFLQVQVVVVVLSKVVIVVVAVTVIALSELTTTLSISQVNELKAKCEQIEKRAAEQRAVEEKKHAEEIQFLKRTNQQLKVRCTVQAGGIN